MWVWCRWDLPRRWRSLLVLVGLVALAGAVVTATMAGAERTRTSVARLNAKTDPADIMVLPNQVGFDWSRVRRLPSVETLGTFVLVQGAEPEGIGISLDRVAGFPPGDRIQNVKVDRPAMISGREADPGRPDEIVVTPGFTTRYGGTVTIRLPTQSEAAVLRAGGVDPGHVRYTGPLVHLHVVGVAVNTFDLGPGGGPQFMPTYAFFRDYLRSRFTYFENARVRLKGGPAAIPAFRAQLARVTHDPNIDVVDWRESVEPIVRAGVFTSTSWLVFSLLALLASIVLVGQSFVRFCSARSDDLRTLESLGLSHLQALAASAAGPVVATVLGAAIALPVAIALSTFFPTGLAGQYEPDPGVSVDGASLAAGAATVVVLGILGGWVAARLTLRHRGAVPVPRASYAAARARQLGLGVPAVLGLSFAFEPGGAKGRASVRPALVGMVAGVLGVVGALTFLAGLDRTVANPARFGQTLSEVGLVSLGSPPDSFRPALRRVARDPDIASFDDMRVDVFPVDGRPVSTFSLDPVRGHVGVVALSGHPPASPREISLAPTTARALGVRTGDTVTVSGRRLTISGITLVPVDSHNGYADGAWLTKSGFSDLQPDLSKDKFHEVRFNFRPGVNPDAALKRLPAGLAPGGLGPASSFTSIDEQVELQSVRVQPLLLGGFLLLLALGAVGHGLISVVHVRRQDIAVLRVFGFTGRQTRLTVAAQATALALVGLIAGIPLGIIAGRSVWRVLAQATPVVYVGPVPLLAIAVLIPIAVVVTNALAAVPANRAARMQIGEILRTE